MKNKILESGKAKMISDAAFTMFLENGYEATGIRAICRAADAELPTLYYHFPSKKALFLSLAEKMLDEYLSSVPNIISDKSDDPESCLRGYFLYIMQYTMTHVPETRFFLRYSLFPPEELREEIQSFLYNDQKRKSELLLPAMMACIKSGLVRHTVDHAMSLFWKFCTNNTFDVIMTAWNPDTNELLNLWNMFMHCRLSENYASPK